MQPSTAQQHKIDKTQQQQIQDLREYVSMLENGIHGLEQGHEYGYKSILTALRAMVADKTQRLDLGILRRFAKDQSFGDLRIKFPGMEGIPETNPLSKDKHVTLTEYLEDSSFSACFHGQPLNVFDLVKAIADEEGVHPDVKVSANRQIGEEVFIGGIQANKWMIFTIARTVLSFAKLIIHRLEMNHPDPQTDHLNENTDLGQI